jgi:hypothetical protein
MKPSQLANQLRRIATAIDKSKNPDRKLVARDLKKILFSISRTAASAPPSSGEKILTDAITKSIEELKQKIPQMGKASAQSVTIPVGTGPELFPRNDNLHESFWYFYWSGDPSDLIQLYGATGTGKRDADLVFEFSQQMFTDPEFVRDVFSAIAEDAYEMATN